MAGAIDDRVRWHIPLRPPSSRRHYADLELALDAGRSWMPGLSAIAAEVPSKASHARPTTARALALATRALFSSRIPARSPGAHRRHSRLCRPGPLRPPVIRDQSLVAGMARSSSRRTPVQPVFVPAAMPSCVGGEHQSTAAVYADMVLRSGLLATLSFRRMAAGAVAVSDPIPLMPQLTPSAVKNR